MSLDDELGIPIMQILGVKKAMEAMNTKLRRSTRLKNRVQRLRYDSYLAHHYAYIASVVQVVEPTCFDDGVGDAKYKKAMDEEMAPLIS